MNKNQNDIISQLCGRILLVEDNMSCANSSRTMLERMGLDVSVIDINRSLQDDIHNSRFDIVLLDVEAQFNMHLDIIDELRNYGLFWASPIILMSSNQQAVQIKPFHVVGIDEYIQKPIQPRLMRDCLRKWLTINGSSPNKIPTSSALPAEQQTPHAGVSHTPTKNDRNSDSRAISSSKDMCQSEYVKHDNLDIPYCNNTRPRILLVDDDLTALHTASSFLSRWFEISLATDGYQALIHAQAPLPPDIILLNIQMPGINGFDVFRHLATHDTTRNIPVIFTTSHDTEAEEERSIKLGAVDYFVKPYKPTVVIARLHTHLKTKTQRDQLNRLSLRDELTGIANRRKFELFLTDEWNRALRFGGVLSTILMDIDHFKSYNDNYGHPAGDKCLATVATTLSASIVRQTDLVARYGGEEFVCILPGTDHHGSLRIAETLHSAVLRLAIPHAYSSAASVVTMSMGVSTITPGRNDARIKDLIEKSDECLYKAKLSGRNRVIGADMPLDQPLANS